MPSTRLQRVAKLIREELSEIIRREINDPRLGFVTITDVEVAPDLRQAHVYFSVYGTPEEQEKSQRVLDQASRFLRGELGRRIDLRYTPELIFVLDRSLERGARVFELLEELKKDRKETDDNADKS